MGEISTLPAEQLGVVMSLANSVYPQSYGFLLESTEGSVTVPNTNLCRQRTVSLARESGGAGWRAGKFS